MLRQTGQTDGSSALMTALSQQPHQRNVDRYSNRSIFFKKKAGEMRVCLLYLLHCCKQTDYSSYRLVCQVQSIDQLFDLFEVPASRCDRSQSR